MQRKRAQFSNVKWDHFAAKVIVLKIVSILHASMSILYASMIRFSDNAGNGGQNPSAAAVSVYARWTFRSHSTLSTKHSTQVAPAKRPRSTILAIPSSFFLRRRQAPQQWEVVTAADHSSRSNHLRACLGFSKTAAPWYVL